MSNKPSMSDAVYLDRLKFYGMSAQEAEQHAVAALYLNTALNTADGAPFTKLRFDSPWDRQGKHPDGTNTEEAFTDTAFVRAAAERAMPWLAFGE